MVEKLNKDDKFIRDAIDKMMEIAGHSVRFDDLKKEGGDWFRKYTMTKDQNDRFKEWYINHSQKVYKRGKRWAQTTFSYFDLKWGLKIEE